VKSGGRPKHKAKPKPKHIRKLWLFLPAMLVAGSVAYYFSGNEKTLLPPPADALYKQVNQPVESRVNDLLSRMTLEEKIGQMALVDKNSVKKLQDVSKYKLGGVLSGAGAKPQDNTPAGWLAMVSDMKAEAAQSRLGIPLLYGIDANHGHANVPGATVFPHAIGLGATSSPELVKNVAAATAEEIAATGINWSYSPSLDAPEDIRWGRVYEAFSSDPTLNGILGSAFVAGTQTNTLRGATQTHILGTAKHFVAGGSMQWGTSHNKNFKIDQGKTPADNTKLLNQYLLPYMAVSDAGVSSVLVGLNHWDDQRVIDNKDLITTHLKNNIGFKGFVVSDWYGMYEFSDTSIYKSNVTAINAGVDMAMLPFDYKAFTKDVKKAVKNDEIPQSRIDDAVRRILTQKFEAGLFDAPMSPQNLSTVGSSKHRALARDTVAASSVLLKNKDSLLPLSKNSGQILIAGSGADNVGRQSGAWTVEWQGVDGNWLPGSTSILKGIQATVAGQSDVRYDKNATFAGLSGKAAIGIAVVSEKPYAEGWGDNAKPQINTEDLAAIAKLKQASEKIVVVIVSGRPLLVTDQIASWDATVAVWLPGSEGVGVADVLFGNKAFSGKLPIAWPAHEKQFPITNNGVTLDGSAPLFVRGYGLTTK
jgi:beta-glucosidase